jgi:hypothetical protein
MFDLFVQAFSDGAFRDVETPEELFALQPHRGRLRRIHWKDGIMKQCVNKNDQGRPMTIDVFRNTLQARAKECGYLEKIIPYDVRRFVMNTAKSE